MADAEDLKSFAERRAGSSPAGATTTGSAPRLRGPTCTPDDTTTLVAHRRRRPRLRRRSSGEDCTEAPWTSMRDRPLRRRSDVRGGFVPFPQARHLDPRFPNSDGARQRIGRAVSRPRCARPRSTRLQVCCHRTVDRALLLAPRRIENNCTNHFSSPHRRAYKCLCGRR